jgi:hypothetical protein
MKQISILIVCLLLLSFVKAQKNFQGEITYKLHAGMDEKPNAQLKVVFGINKIKLLFKESESYDKDALIILLDSAATFIVNKDSKTYKKRLLHINQPIRRLENKTILGYSTSTLVPESNGVGNLLGGLMSASNSVFYLADSFYYAIPDILRGNTELVMIQNNRIVLGADIQISESVYGMTEEKMKDKNLITAEAIEIKPMMVSDSEFVIPADYTTAQNYESTATDSVAAVMDTLPIKPHINRKPTSKKPVKSNKPKAPIKSSAVKPKEQ